MPPPEVLALISELQRLREAFAGATPRQRFLVGLDRVNNPDAYPNDLVTRVSAIEAFARSLVANSHVGSRTEVIVKHRRLEKREAHHLVAAYLKLHCLEPRNHFGEQVWETFRAAVGARNLLVHECTYLDAQKYLPMADACTEVLFALARLSRIRLPKSAA